MLQLRRLQRVGVDLLPHPVHVLGNDVVDVQRARLAVPQAAPRHHDNLQREILVGDKQRLLHVGEGRDGDLLAHVFRLLDALHRVVRHRTLGIRVPKDRLQDPEYVHLISAADPVALHLVQETLDHDRRDRVQLPRSQARNDLHVDRAVDMLPCGVVGHLPLPGPPLLRVLLHRLLPQLAAGRRHGRSRGLLLRIQLREAFDRVVLRAVTGLLALLAQRIAEPDRVGVGAAGGLGAAAVLEEGPKDLLRRRTVGRRSVPLIPVGYALLA